MFSKVLIANRGAIATRAERTLRTMGVASVAIYSEQDKTSLHVSQADEAVYLGDGSISDTYLNIDKVIDACKQTGTQAIFPGYGFLSENQDFAKRCEEEHIAFIGPTPEQMNCFGLKHIARKLAKRSGVPLAPGSDLLTTCEEACVAAKKIGYPVMLKSTAGGGGIGIVICNSEDELRDAFDTSKHLASSNFGNDGVFLERYIANARHIEVQIFGAEGKVLALGERDCSVQRRNQKIVEECPAPHLPDKTRNAMLECSTKLAQSVEYKSAGTVEFLYDEDLDEFYFLEVNTRLQVEHGITEECCGVDLVEWMIQEAAGDPINWNAYHAPQGHAIEVRCYAEDCQNGFLPSTGTIDGCVWPDETRIETWVSRGSVISTSFDPMIAKIIIHEKDRISAVNKARSALHKTRVYGITTNLLYLESLLKTKDYQEGRLSTHILDNFMPHELSLEVLDGGIQTTVQDYPGITGYWTVGIPLCGPMDQRSFRLGNALLGNSEDAAGLEFTLQGGSYKFHSPIWFCLTGADMHATLNNKPIPLNTPTFAPVQSILQLGTSDVGMRSYLCVLGGFDVYEVLGSKSTFIDGKFGGHGGRTLRTGDTIRMNTSCHQEDKTKISLDVPATMSLAHEILQSEECWSHEWTIGVLMGPLSDDEFLDPTFFDTLTHTSYTVDHDSARTGIRLNGPAPEWTRSDGDEAGLHPSNIHDNPYSICALDLTGDQPILLGPDGPSLGGFVCPVVVAIDERWKLGQMKPGDKVHFQILTLKEAQQMRESTDSALALLRKEVRTVAALHENNQTHPSRYPSDTYTPIAALGKLPAQQAEISPYDSILHTEGKEEELFYVRQSGEDALLVEFGPITKLDISLRFKVHVYMQKLEEQHLPLIDMTPGIRSLQLHFDPHTISQSELLKIAIKTHDMLPDLDDVTVSSRIVHLPLSWDDPQTQLAAKRYQETTRPNAPWCPSNIEFIRRINGLDSTEDVKRIVFDAKYLVLGLGDVYLGAPVATPIDPRHRMVTTKYNPARPWTPENAVGIGGAYLCVYGMEGPGGYQFVGRTTQMWNSLRSTPSFKPGKPWLLDFFDQISFYPVAANELLQLREDCLRGKFNPVIEESTFSLREYKKFLEDNKQEIETFKKHQEDSFDAEHQRWIDQGLETFVPNTSQTPTFVEQNAPQGCKSIQAPIAGAVWKLIAQEGEQIQKGQTVMVLESMKMEFQITATENCTIIEIPVDSGSLVSPGQAVVYVRPI